MIMSSNCAQRKTKRPAKAGLGSSWLMNQLPVVKVKVFWKATPLFVPDNAT
jgi:hypothetical protein